jgi:drug/metabolite transporter (DMT)-like permease
LRLRRATLAFIGVVAVVAAAALTADSSLFSLNPADQLYVSIWSLALILACSVVHALYVQKQSASAPEMKTPPNA